MANISSINGNPIVVGTSGIANGAVTDEKLAQSGGIISTVQHINERLDAVFSVEAEGTYKTDYKYVVWDAGTPQMNALWVPLTILKPLKITSITFTTTYSGATSVSAYVTDTSENELTGHYTASAPSGRAEVTIQLEAELATGEYRLHLQLDTGVTMNYPNKHDLEVYSDGYISGVGSRYVWNNQNFVYIGKIAYVTSLCTDDTLTVARAAADAKAVGDAIADLDQMDITVRDNLVYDINHLRITYPDYQRVVNGVYTFTARPSGNAWAEYLVSDSDLQQGIAKWVVNVASCEDGSVWTVYRIFKNVQGAKQYKKVTQITKAGRYEFDIDLNYMSVYEEYDGNGVSLCIASNAESGGKTIVIDQYDLTEQVSDFDNLPRSLNSVLNEVRGDIDALENAAAPELVLRSYTGDGYVLQVDQSGNLKVVPVLPSNILYIGNSLLIGFGTHGMASTDVGDDYYGKVNAYLTSKGVTPTTIRLNGGGFEGAENDATVNSWLDGTLANYMSSDRELVLIQLGDNVNTDAKRAEFAKSAGMLCSYIREHCPNARVAWVGEWYYNTIKQTIIRDACSKYGCTFVDISDLPNIEGNRNRIGATYIDENGDEQTITIPGVASHPSDQGFTQIAERIIAALFE